MKTKQIKTEVADILLVELPEGSKDAIVMSNNKLGFYRNGISMMPTLPLGNWKLISRADQVTEEQATMLFKEVHHYISGDRIFEDFTYYTDKPRTTDRVFKIALESIDSLYEVEKIY